MTYLENPQNLAEENRIGALSLVALAAIKQTGNLRHPSTDKALAAIDLVVAAIKARKSVRYRDDIYNVAISLIFLAEHDPSRNAERIRVMLKHFLYLQKPHGGWGYFNRVTGDTSMTQYAVLALWTCERAGFFVPRESWETVSRWLFQVQAPNGSYGYQGQLARRGVRRKQDKESCTLTFASLGALYVCLDRHRAGNSWRGEANDAIPEEFESVGDAQQYAGPPRFAIDQIQEAIQLGEAWLVTNYTIHARIPDLFPLYHLYAIERFESFRESELGRPNDYDWYTAGAEFLIRKQGRDGSFRGNEVSGFVPSTAFGVLFLLRSTARSIEKARNFGAGLLTGGRGIPDREGEIIVREGQLRARPLKGPAESLLRMLEDPNSGRFEAALEGISELLDHADAQVLSPHQARFQKLMLEQNPRLRVAAVRAIGRTRRLDAAPDLITALSDPDANVVRAADEGLRYLSRKLGRPPLPSRLSDEVRRQAISFWSDWYLALRPEARGALE